MCSLVWSGGSVTLRVGGVLTGTESERLFGLQYSLLGVVAMVPLPLELVDRFEHLVENSWCGGPLSRRRDALIIGLGLLGLRWVEVSRLTFRDVDLVGARVFVHTAKGGPGRTVFVGRSWLRAFLSVAPRYWRHLPSKVRLDSPCFLTSAGRPVTREQVHRTLARWTRSLFGRAYSFHCLRHTFAVRLYLATRDVLKVHRALGHASLRWTGTYLQVLESATWGLHESEGFPGFVTGAQAVGSELRIFQPSIEYWRRAK